MKDTTIKNYVRIVMECEAGRASHRVTCPCCLRPTHPAELVSTPRLGESCLKCVEDSRVENE